MPRPFRTIFLGVILFTSFTAQSQSAPATSLPSEIPPQFAPVTNSFEYIKKTVMIPMRDGVRLHTVIIVPKGAKHAPILLTRTPYDADALTSHSESSHLEPILQGYDNVTDVIAQDGYIRVVQDVRGKYGSEGDYVMNRPLRGPLNPTAVDHATDTYDTIDWLVKNIPESNGKVGVLGISYDGFTTLMAMFNPHPALKVVIPMNPMVDGWRGDDWFHNGAFREQTNLAYIYDQEATRKNDEKWWTSYHDEYDAYLNAGSAGAMAKSHGLEQVGFWRKIMEHPTYDAWWQEQAMDKLLAKEPLKVPVMLVHGLWDQEDIYGAPAVYSAIEPKDMNNDMVYLVMGPWHHGQQILEGSSLGPIKFDSDTAKYFRQHILRPFLAQYLIDGAPRADVAPVNAFVTGTNHWERLKRWPSGCTNDCAPNPTSFYLNSNLKLTSVAPPANNSYVEYVSDPSKPVQYRPRPIALSDSAGWKRWLVEDQREQSGRPDVVSFVSDVLTSPLKIAGAPMVNLVASTSGTDSDWVVKVIDVYPDEYAPQPEMGGYQLMVSADIFRGRYRESLSDPKPLTPDKSLTFRFALPNANHVFLPGHRVMVQVQSTWFPLYDRNPQKFVPNIMFAKPEDFQKATQRIYASSFVELPVVATK